VIDLAIRAAGVDDALFHDVHVVVDRLGVAQCLDERVSSGPQLFQAVEAFDGIVSQLVALALALPVSVEAVKEGQRLVAFGFDGPEPAAG
jgi:hypothetical protein